MNITVVGTGYVGLVTGTCFANSGNQVTCLDIDSTKIDSLRKSEPHFFEPGLSELITRSMNAGRLMFTDSVSTAYENPNVIFICVGTPTGADGRCNLSQVMRVADDISNSLSTMQAPPVVVVKSTVPVGTTHKIAALLHEPCSIANNPEFLREGNAVDDFMRPDRVVCGVEDDHAKQTLTQLYTPFIGQGRPLQFFDIQSSEMVKYASNAMLACKISFINEIASLCECNGADIDSVRTGMCADNRIGTEFFNPGIGYGGSCFPKDTLAVMEMGEEANAPCLVNTAVHEINQRQRHWFVQRVISHFNESIGNKKFALWGLAFKPRTDDVRDAPSIEIAKTLIAAGAEVLGYDPEASTNFKTAVPDITIVDDMYEALHQVDGLIICTEWSQFRTPDFEKVKRIMREPTIFDGRNIYTCSDMEKMGFHYFSVGRPTVQPSDFAVVTD